MGSILLERLTNVHLRTQVIVDEWHPEHQSSYTPLPRGSNLVFLIYGVMDIYS